MEEGAKRPTVILGVTGSVATVKIPELCVKLSKYTDIIIVATKPSLHFLGISKEYNPKAYEEYEKLSIPVLTDDDEWNDYHSVKKDPVLHVDLRNRGDLLAIIPLTANTLGKMTCGICDNLLTSAYRAWGSKKPIIVAPCMNTEMFNHPLTSQQLEQIKKWGVEVIEPCEKLLACGDVGKGALPPVDEVVKRIRSILSSSVCQQTRLFLLSLLRTDQESRRSKRLQECRRVVKFVNPHTHVLVILPLHLSKHLHE